jgi:hypothetical protein
VPARRAAGIPALRSFPLPRLILVNRGDFVHRNNPSAIADAATPARATGQYIGK